MPTSMPVLFAAAVRMIVAPCRANLHSSALARTQVSTEAGGDGAALNVRCIHLWTTIFALKASTKPSDSVYRNGLSICMGSKLCLIPFAVSIDFFKQRFNSRLRRSCRSSTWALSKWLHVLMWLKEPRRMHDDEQKRQEFVRSEALVNSGCWRDVGSDGLCAADSHH
jgi:hypothetical protein